MSLLLFFPLPVVVRATALSLILGLVSGLVSTATVHQETVTCRQELPAELMKDLWSRTRLLINKLPKEENFSRRSRLLPKFSTKDPECAIGWLEMRELIDVYQRRVFSRGVIQKLLPVHYNDLLYRVQHTLQHCVSSSEPSKHFKLIKKLEKKIKKRKRDEGVLKAVGEFTFVLRWMDELAQHYVL